MSAFSQADPAQIRSLRPLRVQVRRPKLWHPLRSWLTPSLRPADTARALAEVVPLRRLEPLGEESRWWHATAI